MSKRYLVFALNHRRFLDWCRQHNINARNPQIVYVSDSDRMRGWRDYDVVLLDDYARNPLYGGDDYARHVWGQAEFAHSQWDKPLVEDGRIVGWER